MYTVFQNLKSTIPTYHLEQINDGNPSLKEVFYSDEKLFALRNMLNTPYRSNYYGLGLCISGSANLVCNLDNYLVKPNAIITMSPQVIKQWKDVSEDFDTITIFFTKAFFSKIFANQNYLDQFHFFEQNTKHVHNFSTSETVPIFDLFQKINKHINHPHPYHDEILANYISILLFEYQSLFEQVHCKNTYQQTRNQQLVESFKNLINQYFRQERSVQFYANKLFISSKYLSEILKNETGKTASEWISDLLLLEAKVLLSNRNLQINQIAEVLHFPDVSTFGKFFKNLSGSSPLQYRKNL
ncbi:MAG TPA: AraC family transcriptional regulator [Saprospiraceae bacterium]|nr:AraC family transcriptional regulator [Saprospiraceae bacterium]